MALHQNLTVEIPNIYIGMFKTKMLDYIKSNNWPRHADLEVNYLKNTSTKIDEVFCLESPYLENNNEQLHVYLWAKMTGNIFDVFNIVGVSSGVGLGVSEDNFILWKFHEAFIQPLRSKLNLNVSSSETDSDLAASIGQEAATALIDFSATDIQSIEHLDSTDLNKWFKFIFLIHRQNKQYNSGALSAWLQVERHWDSDVIAKVSSNYDYSLALLKQYNS